MIRSLCCELGLRIATYLPYLAAFFEERFTVDTQTRVALARSPGLGLGWTRVARAVADAVPPGEIDGIWLFAPVRREDREWGRAVISRHAESGRRRSYTASYLVVVRGRERGQGKVPGEEVGPSPAAVVHEVIAGVQQRAGELNPPTEIAREHWFGEDHDESPADD